MGETPAQTQHSRPGGVAEMVASLRAAIGRGADWIAEQVASDGTPVGAGHVNHWYRLPWAMALAGRPDVASAVLSWAEREALTPEGDLREGPPRENWDRVGWNRTSAAYPLAILAVGAWHAERYDTAGRIMDTLRAFQSPISGGAYVERPEHRETGVQDLLCTAQLGLAALTTGRADVATAAYGWLARFVDEQPDLPDRLFLRATDDGLVTTVPSGGELRTVLDTTRPRQAFYMPGIGAAFAGRYAQSFGDEAAAGIGRRLLEVSRRAHPSQFDFTDTVHVGKFGWGAGVMLDLGDEAALADALRLGQWYLDSQSPDGRWNPTRFLVPEPDDVDALWKTTEHVVLMTMVVTGLAGHPRRRFGS